MRHLWSGCTLDPVVRIAGLLCATFWLGLVLLWILFAQPMFTEWALAKQRLQDVKVTYSQFNQLKENVQKGQAHLVYLEALAGKLKTPVRASLIIQEISEVSKSSDVSIIEESYSKLVNRNGRATLDVNLRVSGEYENIKKLIFKIEAMKHFAIIKKATISSEAERDISADLEIGFVGAEDV